MNKAKRIALPFIAAGLLGAPALAVPAFGAAAGSASAARATSTAVPGTPRPASAPRPGAAKPLPKPLTPRPVNVYVGAQLVAVGQSVGGGIARVRGQLPFPIKTPAYVPGGYVPLQLAITPQQRGVSNGFSTLTYAPSRHGMKTYATTSGFQINQTADLLPFVKSTGTVTTTVGGNAGMLNEFKAGKTDILILTWGDAAGNGYTVTTDAATSRLSRADLIHIGASLR